MDLQAVAAGRLAEVAPYEPGITSAKLRREQGLETIYKFSSNELPYAPSPAVVTAIQEAATGCNRYPDYHDLVRQIAGHHGLDTSQVVLGNGSIDVIELAVRMVAKPGKNLVLSSYGYSAFPLLAKVCGMPVRLADSNAQYGHQAGALTAACDRDTAAVVVDSPTNMSGQTLSLFEIERILTGIPANALLILDQAYIDFCPHELDAAYISLLRKYPNLLITRTFSKAYGLAGLRVGYGLASPELARWLYKLQRPFPVAGVAVAAAMAALRDQVYLTTVKRDIAVARELLGAGLEQLGFNVLAGDGNFLLVELDSESKNLFTELLNTGFITRPMAAYGRPDLLRISIGLNEELVQLMNKIRTLR